MTERIRFLLNGRVRDISDLAPTTTLLEYLRTVEHLTGSKEGCAEGDCGACTVVVGELREGRVRYRSANACILLLPMLDGLEVITVERLKTLAGGGPHPVQQAMVEHHASQCGFCTPGFVMSLFALYHEDERGNRHIGNGEPVGAAEIHDAIAGNLCRCTGYRPILAAARAIASQTRPALPDTSSALTLLQRDRELAYRVPSGAFFAPRSLAELSSRLAKYPDATLVAGATDVGLWVTKQQRSLPILVHAGRVDALRRIASDDAGLMIGAAATWSEARAALVALEPGLAELLSRFASMQIRNSATVGGNIANGSPIGDGMPPLIALGARLRLCSNQGERELALEDYYLDYGRQDRRPGEFVASIFVPRPAPSTVFRVWKLSKRFDQDISALCGAFALDIRAARSTPEGDQPAMVRAARIAFGGMAGIPRRASASEAALTGQPWTEASLEAAIAALDQDFTPIGDHRASAEYRRLAGGNLLRRLFVETTRPEVATGVYRHAG